MEKIINFTGPANFKRKDRHFKQNTYLSEQSENSSADEEQDNSSPVYKKKSHFGKEKEFSFKPPAQEEKKINQETAFDTDESETNTPKSPSISYFIEKLTFFLDLENNFAKGATKNIHSKFRSATQVMREEAENALKNQKNMIKGDTDNTLPEEEL